MRIAPTSTYLSPIDVGDIVVVHDQNHPRGFWKLAKVEKLFTGKDNHIRGARLRLHLKNGHVTILQWPLQLFYPQQAAGRESQPLPDGKQVQNEDHIGVYKQNESDSSSDVGDTQRPRRLSTKRAQNEFKLWSSEMLGSGDDDHWPHSVVNWSTRGEDVRNELWLLFRTKYLIKLSILDVILYSCCTWADTLLKSRLKWLFLSAWIG